MTLTNLHSLWKLLYQQFLRHPHLCVIYMFIERESMSCLSVNLIAAGTVFTENRILNLTYVLPVFEFIMCKLLQS